MANSNELAQLLGGSDSLPILFVGSGLSRRYIDAPDWEGLVRYAASLTSNAFDYYSGKLPEATEENDRLPLMGSLIAQDFYDIWWKADEYGTRRENWKHPLTANSDPLKVMIADYIQSHKLASAQSLIDEYAKLSGAKVHAIVTTNYDTLLESAFPDFKVFIGQQNVLFSSPQYVGEIYKIHGSAEDPSSLVFTSDDYKTYWEKNPYIIAKMLTLFVEHPVVFIGYSLRDPHILRLLAELVACLTEAQLGTLNDRLIFVGRVGSNRSRGLSKSTITVEGHTFGVTEFGVDDFSELYDVLAELPEHYPVKLLRKLSESVTQMAYSDSSGERVHVIPLQPGEDADDVEMVVGIGAFERLGVKGYSPYSRTEFFLDMLTGATDHNIENMVDHLIPLCFRSAKFSPIWYAMHLASSSGHPIDLNTMPERAKNLLNGTTPVEPYAGRRPTNWEQMGFRELLKSNPDLVENLSVGCRYDLEDVVALRDFLYPNFVGKTTITTNFAKCAAKFDRLVYGPDFTGNKKELWAKLGVA